jgi:hypothetical protein
MVTQRCVTHLSGVDIERVEQVKGKGSEQVDYEPTLEVVERNGT